MNNINNKKYKSLILLIVVLGLFVYSIYYLNSNLRGYKDTALADYNKLAELENEKGILSVYNKIVLKGSKESLQVEKHILIDDRKQLLNLTNDLEDYSKKNSLSGDNSIITSVSKRENASISRFKARDIVINISISGDEKKIEDFLNLLNNLPIVSYLEKIDVKFDSLNNKNSANITLVIYQKDEIK